MLTRRLLSTGAALVLAVVAVVAVLLAVGVTIPGLSELTGASYGTTCTASPGEQEHDIDTDDSDEAPWPRTPGQPAVVYFETGSLPARYARFVEQGAAAWSKGPCVRAVAVARCPANTHCSTSRTAPGKGDDGETDGESEGNDQGGVRTGDTLTLYPELLDKASDNGALVTVTHEMGHALGLRHRDTDGVLMNAETGDDTPAAPDATDYDNLRVVYGTPTG